jgi:hypothetical protein
MTEGGEVIALGAEVVIDHVEEDRQARAMASLDQPLQAVRPAVAMLRSEGVNPVVPPTALARELA